MELTWTDGSIVDKWLEVTVHADANTGLSAPFTFFYGNLPGNSGTGNTSATAYVTSTDENAVRSHNGTATLTSTNAPFDFNRDGFVNSSDESLARSNAGSLRFIKIPANTPLAPDAVPAMAPDVTVIPATAAHSIAAAPANSGGDTGLASGLARLLGIFNPGTVLPLRLDLLSSELKKVNLDSGAAATILRALAAADTKLARSILVEADKIADELGLDDSLLDSILADLGLE